MDWLGWVVLAGAILLGSAASVWLWKKMGSLGRQIQLERARESFFLQRQRLETHFLDRARASMKPRGLLWKNCEFLPEVEFARDRHTGQVAALVGVAIQFEAREGSDPEMLPRVSQWRSASAVFFFQKGHWLTTGKTLFNLSPSQAIDHFGRQYERVVASGPHP